MAHGHFVLLLPMVGMIGAFGAAVSVNGTCQVGNCASPDQAATGTSPTTAFNFVITLPNSDQYRIAGAINAINAASAPRLVSPFTATYLGNSTGTVSGADVVEIDVLQNFQLNFTLRTSTESVQGGFSGPLAAGSNVQGQLLLSGQALPVMGPFPAPANFSFKSPSYNLLALGSVVEFNVRHTFTFAAGSGVGSTIYNAGGSQADLQTSVSSLSFNTNAGGEPAGSQSFSVSSSGADAVSFAVATDAGQSGAPPPPWLHVSPTGGMTPGRITATADPGALEAGQYSARIALTIPGSTVSPLYVPVTLIVKTGSPQLDVVPSFLNFAAHVESAGILDQPLLVRNSGGGGPLGFSVAVVSGGSWLSVGAAGGQTSSNASTVVHVQANAGGLKVGGYHGSIRVTADTNSVDVPVELFVASSGSILGLNITAVRFQSRQGNGTSTVQNVSVLNLGDSGTTINWTAQVVLGSEILDLGVTGGTATPQAPGILPMKPSAASVGRPAGGYYALVEISDPQALNSPQYVTAVLDQAGSATLPLPDPAPQGLVFIAAAGGAAPPPQSITISVDSAVPIAFQASASTTGGTWLSATPATGTTSATAATPPAQVSAMVNQHGLTAGIYTGEVDIALANSLRAVNVTLIVVPGGSASTALARAPSATGSAACAPSKLALTQTGLVNSFSVPAGWPAALIVQLNDDCGNAVPGGSVTASFSNGDPTLMLRGDSSGAYSATWQPGSVTPQIDITLDAEAVNLQPSVFHLIGGINQNQNAPPRLSNNGIVNVFDRVPAGALAPGMIVEVYGSGLAGANGNPGSLPLPNSFQGTSMIVGGYQLPVYFVSGGQLDVQIPAELPPNQQYPILVNFNGALSLPATIDVNSVQLGIATLADGHAIAQHGADSSSVDSTHPAKPGEILVMYLSGMGATNPSVKSGDPAPKSEPLARVTIQPTVTVDGQDAAVQFAGLTPGLVGLYQINFQVPGGAKSGDLSLTATQNGVSSNETKLPVLR